MQVTTNVVTLPSIVVDAYLDMLSASVNPILAEESLPSKAQHAMLQSAYYACSKAICMKFMPELEAAGLFKGVVSIDYPKFQWTRGMKFVYAVDFIIPCLVKTMVEEMVSKDRDVTSFTDFLEAYAAIAIDKATADLLEHADGPAVKRLEEHALGLAKANGELMVGETAHIVLQTLDNVRRAVKNGSDTPLDSFEYDLEYLVPSATTYL